MKKHSLSLLVLILLVVQTFASVREKYNFNSQWLLYVGDVPEAKNVNFQDKDWKKITLPRPFNEDEAFKLDIHNLTDTIMWYRKHFRLPAEAKGKKVFVEFEGVREGADFYGRGMCPEPLLYLQWNDCFR